MPVVGIIESTAEAIVVFTVDVGAEAGAGFGVVVTVMVTVGANCPG